MEAPNQGVLLMRCQELEVALAAAQEAMWLLRQDAEAASSHASALESEKAALQAKYDPPPALTSHACSKGTPAELKGTCTARQKATADCPWLFVVGSLARLQANGALSSSMEAYVISSGNKAAATGAAAPMAALQNLAVAAQEDNEWEQGSHALSAASSSIAEEELHALLEAPIKAASLAQRRAAGARKPAPRQRAGGQLSGQPSGEVSEDMVRLRGQMTAAIARIRALEAAKAEAARKLAAASAGRSRGQAISSDAAAGAAVIVEACPMQAKALQVARQLQLRTRQLQARTSISPIEFFLHFCMSQTCCLPTQTQRRDLPLCLQLNQCERGSNVLFALVHCRRSSSSGMHARAPRRPASPLQRACSAGPATAARSERRTPCGRGPAFQGRVALQVTAPARPAAAGGSCRPGTPPAGARPRSTAWSRWRALSASCSPKWPTGSTPRRWTAGCCCILTRMRPHCCCLAHACSLARRSARI